MVSSDFGKLDVNRHLISGEDWAIAGAATAVAAAPTADTFRKSRRFIARHLLLEGDVSHMFIARAHRIASDVERERFLRAFNTEQRAAKRAPGMTALYQSRISRGVSRFAMP